MACSILASLLVLSLISLAQSQVAFKCPVDKLKNSYYPDSIQCDLYYHCSDGQLVEEKLCPDGLLFDDSNPAHERCDTNVNVECGERTELQEPKPTKGCPRANGFFRHYDEKVCDKFVNCVDGVPNELPCPPGLIYDDSVSSCAWPSENTRKDCTVTKKDTLTDGFSCPDGEVMGPNGRPLPHPTFPHPEDCQKFYICRNGVQAQYGSCPAGSVYNEESFKCDEPENVPGCENWFGEDNSTGDKKNSN
ncbi:protein obstructor-E-like [Diaphorina citri]|uniref:Protein obstructor-E-like n=2 Tax=Diaphorina citri TaxID=121845 RepID=A0A1S3DGK4_DIACI|nr:protein obstructor-E-like [Diaphorina citri]